MVLQGNKNQSVNHDVVQLDVLKDLVEVPAMVAGKFASALHQVDASDSS